jgi:multimeric flavodoxin WrbA
MGNTAILVNEALKGAQQEGAENVEFFSLSGKEIKPCDGCETCLETGRCHIDDDMQTVYQKLVEADGIIYGSPIYHYNMTAQAKALIDRTLIFCGRTAKVPNRLANKVGGVIVVGGGSGRIDAVKDLYFYIVIHHMIPADYVAALAHGEGVVREDKISMKAACELGREMVQLSRRGFKYPTEFDRPLKIYAKDKYGL